MRCRNIITPFYKSVAHPRFEYRSRGRLSYLNEDINERVKGQPRAADLIRSLRNELGAEARGWILLAARMWVIRALYYRDVGNGERPGGGKCSNEGLPEGQGGVPIYSAS